MPTLLVKLSDGTEYGVLLEKPLTTIGRRPDNDIVIKSREVSGYHAEISMDGNRFVVRDKQSTNGIFVNNLPIARCSIKPGDSVHLGHHELMLLAESYVPTVSTKVTHSDTPEKTSVSINNKNIPDEAEAAKIASQELPQPTTEKRKNDTERAQGKPAEAIISSAEKSLKPAIKPDASLKSSHSAKNNTQHNGEDEFDVFDDLSLSEFPQLEKSTPKSKRDLDSLSESASTQSPSSHSYADEPAPKSTTAIRSLRDRLKFDLKQQADPKASPSESSRQQKRSSEKPSAPRTNSPYLAVISDKNWANRDIQKSDKESALSMSLIDDSHADESFMLDASIENADAESDLLSPEPKLSKIQRDLKEIEDSDTKIAESNGTNHTPDSPDVSPATKKNHNPLELVTSLSPEITQAKNKESQDLALETVEKPISNVTKLHNLSYQHQTVNKSELFTADSAFPEAEPIQLDPTTRASLHIKSGAKAGKTLMISRPVITVGLANQQIVAISRRADGYYLIHVESTDDKKMARINGQPIKNNAVRLADGDWLEIADVELQFSLTHIKKPEEEFDMV